MEERNSKQSQTTQHLYHIQNTLNLLFLSLKKKNPEFWLILLLVMMNIHLYDDLHELSYYF